MDVLETLALRAKQGDAHARDQLLRRLEPVMRGFFVNRIGLRAEVDDLTQNSLLRVHRGLEDLKDDSRLKAFAMKGALYELQDFYRGRYRPKEVLYDAQDPPEYTDENGHPSQRMDVETALSTLTPRAREIIELRESGFRYEEIASMIDSTEAAVKMQVKRAFERMRDTLAMLLMLLIPGW